MQLYLADFPNILAFSSQFTSRDFGIFDEESITMASSPDLLRNISLNRELVNKHRRISIF